ncbi:tetratricopeptide repeat protein [Shewanella halotolerans]|uniref:tetratricopeptide repeat protein n=1 Tax=Shewanella halotolerans TaxID=2864204 RepID=UPI001C65D416|nr:tetratricopeptide repeat protein [Shewanella halotolerans]QYJ90896.1 sel1 repeat family protein [Shewanella halotolerans]
MQVVIFSIILALLFISLLLVYLNWRGKQPIEVTGGPDEVIFLANQLLHSGREAQALDYLERAAAMGMAHAAQFLGELYSLKDHHLYDLDKANHWFQQAGELDEQFAQIQRQMLKLKVHPSQEGGSHELEAMLKPGADKGNSQHQGELGRLYQESPQLDPDGSKALHYLELAAEAGNAEAQYHLAKVLLEPRHGKPDPIRARALLTAIADSEPLAKSQLAQMLLRGEGGPAEPREAERLMREEAEDNEFALIELAHLYQEGKHLPKDIDKAEECLRQAMAMENNSATYQLGELLLKHKRANKSHLEAIALLTPLAQQWMTDALFLLGQAHEEGLGTRRHLPTALAYYRLAATDPAPYHLERVETLSAKMGSYEKEQAESLYQAFLTEHPIEKSQQACIDLTHGLRLLHEDDRGRRHPREAISFLERAALAGENLAFEPLHKACAELSQRIDAAVWAQIALEDQFYFLPTGEMESSLASLKQGFSESEQALFEQRLQERQESLTGH